MKKIIVLIIAYFTCTAALIAMPCNEDSSRYTAIIQEGTKLLRERIAYNNSQQAGSSNLNYLVQVDGGLPQGADQPDGLTTERQINGFKGFFSPDNAINATAKTKFSNRLTALNEGKAIKVYYLLINGFNLEYRAKIDSGTSVTSIFNSKLIDENTDMLRYQKTHDSLSTAILEIYSLCMSF